MWGLRFRAYWLHGFLSMVLYGHGGGFNRGFSFQVRV